MAPRFTSSVKLAGRQCATAGSEFEFGAQGEYQLAKSRAAVQHNYTTKQLIGEQLSDLTATAI
jgi:hypothetical protein